MQVKKHWWFWGGLLITVVATGWYLLSQPMFYTHDFLHGARIAEMARGLQEGQWPVIWSENFAWGYGMPVFEFYAPLPYLLGAIFSLLGANLVWATKIMFLLTSVGSYLGMYFWAREFSEEKIASLSGGLFALASYRAMDIFARGALSEIMAIMALPWVFWSLTRLVRAEKKWLLVTVGSFAWLILSHNITTMLVAPSAVFYLVLLMTVEKKWSWLDLKKILLKLLAAAAATLILTAFYLIPAFFEQNQTQLKTWILQDYFDYTLHFVYPKQLLKDNFGYGGSGYGDNDGLSFFLGWTQWLLLIITAAVLVGQIGKRAKKKKGFDDKELILMGGGGLILFFNLWMTTYWSAGVWRWGKSLLEFTQFPWRFLGVAAAFVALVAPWCLWYWPKKRQSKKDQSEASLNWLVAGLWLILIASSWRYFWGDETNTTNAATYYNGDPTYIREQLSQVMVDYLPKKFANDWQAVPVTEKWFGQTSGQSEVRLREIIIDEMAHKKYQVEASQAAKMELTIADYPEWQIAVNGVTQEKMTSERGNLLVQIEPGTSIIEAELRPTSLRWWCNLVSAGGWLVALFASGKYLWQKRTKKQ